MFHKHLYFVSVCCSSTTSGVVRCGSHPGQSYVNEKSQCRSYSFYTKPESKFYIDPVTLQMVNEHIPCGFHSLSVWDKSTNEFSEGQNSLVLTIFIFKNNAIMYKYNNRMRAQGSSWKKIIELIQIHFHGIFHLDSFATRSWGKEVLTHPCIQYSQGNILHIHCPFDILAHYWVLRRKPTNKFNVSPILYI